MAITGASARELCDRPQRLLLTEVAQPVTEVESPQHHGTAASLHQSLSVRGREREEGRHGGQPAEVLVQYVQRHLVQLSPRRILRALGPRRPGQRTAPGKGTGQREGGVQRQATPGRCHVVGQIRRGGSV